MAATGVAFAAIDDYAILLVVAIGYSDPIVWSGSPGCAARMVKTLPFLSSCMVR